MKLAVYKDADIDETGVEQVWVMECPDEHCQTTPLWRISTLYWENAVRAASHHISYHKQKAARG